MNKNRTILINGKEYSFDGLTPNQQLYANHILDLERKLGSARFNVDQMTVGLSTFVNMFEQSLKQDLSSVG